ncbi:MAG: hypothetical protein AB8G22_28880 [Saprospiraceae bacterium]
MNFKEFEKKFNAYPIFSKSEIDKRIPDFDRNALTRWQQKDYLRKIRNGLYYFSDQPIDNSDALFYVANELYSPSYISLASALSYYGFIPEGVFTTTSVSTLRTRKFSTDIGNFSFQTLKKELFLGYRLLPYQNHFYKIATPTKAFFDYLYLNPKFKTEADFFEWRLNFRELQLLFSEQEFRSYLDYTNSPTLQKRGLSFLKFLKENDVTGRNS